MVGSVAGVGGSSPMPPEESGNTDAVAVFQQLKQQIDSLTQNLNDLSQNPQLSSDTSYQQKVAQNVLALQQANQKALTFK